MDITTIKKELKGRVAKGLNFGVEAVDEVLQTDSELYNQFILLKNNLFSPASSRHSSFTTLIAVWMKRLRHL